MKIKKIFYLLIIFIVISSCTLNNKAHLGVECPYVVARIDKTDTNERIGVKSLDNEYEFFIFKTTSLNYYSLGDTIR